MGTASCKSLKSSIPNQQKEDDKTITIGVFGLDDAGKTSIIKAIQGEPTDNISPTTSPKTITITRPYSVKNDNSDKNKLQQHVQIIDVSGEERFRQQSWLQYYDQIHGYIFVIDASERNRFRENQDILEDLLEHDKLKSKPILFLANKQDQRGAINNEYDFKRKFNIDRLKTKYNIEFCSALPQNRKNKVDGSIEQGFSWLIETINDNFKELNSRIIKPKSIRINRQSESDENKNLRTKNSKITSEKLPSITTNKNKIKTYSDDEDDDNKNNLSPLNGLNKKKKVVGAPNTNVIPKKNLRDNETKAFRSTYEAFPEETPWSTPSTALKLARSDDILTRLNTKSSLTGDTKRRDVSPLIRDTKSYTNNSSLKRDNNSDDDDEDYNRLQKSKPISRFDTSPYSTNRFSSNTKQPPPPSTSIYNDNYSSTNNHYKLTTSNKSYNHDDEDDEDNYIKKTTTNNKSIKNYSQLADRSNLNKRSTYDHDDDYSISKPTNRSKYNDDNDDDDTNHRWSSSKPTTGSKYGDDDDDDYPSSKMTTHSKYNNDNRALSASKPVSRSKYEDDDDDHNDYTSASKKNTYSSYNNYNGSSGSRPRVGTDDFFTSKNESNNTNRFRKNTYYDD
ncbi:unnamed protein product [Adineta steineri]|uniref:Uncharacterized protein n=1 Tax=Adineta steineri TaxID=433720 RepID=A0A818V8U1_9BILA|nr:unnamed protein product [Adineta steineri]